MILPNEMECLILIPIENDFGKQSDGDYFTIAEFRSTLWRKFSLEEQTWVDDLVAVINQNVRDGQNITPSRLCYILG
jgi:hypothetical protein